jgi:hypothetical protein
MCSSKESPAPKDEMAYAIVSPEPAVAEVSASWFKKLKDNTIDQDLHTQSMHKSSKA